MKLFLAIALGGSAGALSRYYISRFIAQSLASQSSPGTLFPFGTLAVNVTGALLIGFFYGLFDKTIVSPEVRSFITIGFLGALTTFSTFALENIHLFRDGEIKLALVNIFFSNLFCLLCVIGGMYIAGLLVHK